MATVTIKWSGNPPCGKGNLPYVGESYFLYLDQSYFATDVSAAISATFVSEGPGGSGYERTYTFEFLDAAIPTGFAVVDSCHVKSVGCVDSCCAELQRQINDIDVGANAHLASAAYDSATGDITYTLTDGSTLTGNLPPITVEGSDNAVAGTSTSIIRLGDAVRFWSAGGLEITAANGSTVNIEPDNVSVADATAGAPVSPADQSRPAIHFASEGLYYWNPATVAWVLLQGLSGPESTVIVETEAELVAACGANETHITLGGIIALTAKLTVPNGTTTRVGHDSGFDCGGQADILEHNGDLEAGEATQVFYNTVPYERLADDIVTYGSVWGKFNARRTVRWWGPDAHNGTQSDQVSIQCAIDSWPLTAIGANKVAALPGRVYVPAGKEYELTDTIRLQNTRVIFEGDLGTQLNFRIPAGGPQTSCIDMSDTPATNNVWDCQVMKFRITDYSARDGVRTDLITIQSNHLEERSAIRDVQIASYGSHAIWIDAAGGNTGTIENININAGYAANPVGIRITGINGSIKISNCSVVNASTYIAFWNDRNGGSAVTFTNCHEENATIGFLVGPDPATSPSIATRDRSTKQSIVDCTSNTKQAGERGIYITSGTATVYVRNFDCDGSNVAAIVLEDQVIGSNDTNLPLLNTSLNVGISEFRRWPRINTLPSYVRRSDGTTGGLPAGFGGWDVYWVLDIFGI